MTDINNDLQRIFRAETQTEKFYFTTRRMTAQDSDLSWEARGMLWYLLSKPIDWEVRIKDLQQQCGRDRVYTIITELREKGYMHYIQQRDADGKMTDAFYRVFEEPQPLTPLPDTASPDTANPEHTNKREKQIREKEQGKAHALPASSTPVTTEPEKKKPLSANKLFVAAYLDLLKMELCDGNRKKITDNAARLWKKGKGYSIADLQTFDRWWSCDDNAYRNAVPPGIHQINERLHWVVTEWAPAQVKASAIVPLTVTDAFELLEGN
ncbi:hypothetical protein LCGC14_1685170 [marine sediment metagenome]|uniref:Uncharacterized protein n=1 Tax=marine sediment metagenome TaxID=412755 RepID=A0A0F9HMV6_9ZZZZ